MSAIAAPAWRANAAGNRGSQPRRRGVAEVEAQHHRRAARECGCTRSGRHRVRRPGTRRSRAGARAGVVAAGSSLPARRQRPPVRRRVATTSIGGAIASPSARRVAVGRPAPSSDRGHVQDPRRHRERDRAPGRCGPLRARSGCAGVQPRGKGFGRAVGPHRAGRQPRPAARPDRRGPRQRSAPAVSAISSSSASQPLLGGPDTGQHVEAAREERDLRRAPTTSASRRTRTRRSLNGGGAGTDRRGDRKPSLRRCRSIGPRDRGAGRKLALSRYPKVVSASAARGYHPTYRRRPAGSTAARVSVDQALPPPRTGRPSVRRTTSSTSFTYSSASPRSAAVRTQPWTWSSRTRIASGVHGRAQSGGLLEDVDAVLLALDHPRDPADLALDARLSRRTSCALSLL